MLSSCAELIDTQILVLSTCAEIFSSIQNNVVPSGTSQSLIQSL